jgi:hypothetical protein
MKFSRETWLALGLVLLLILVTAGAALQQSQTADIPYLSNSSLPDGALALKLWLSELDYHVIDTVAVDFFVPQEADLVFMLQPLGAVTQTEWQDLDRWVKDGGTLVLAGDMYPTFQAMEHYGFTLSLIMQQTEALVSQTPLLSSPPLTAPVPVRSDFYLNTQRSDFVTHLAMDGRPVLVSFDLGQGRVILSATPIPFSNQALKEDAIAVLALNMIGLSAQGGSAWFDEWHHGIQGSSVVGPDQWLRSSSLGHALLFLVGAIFLSLLLGGRIFGRPVPLPHEIKRRGPLEHVTAIANLNRRAGHRGSVLQQYHSRLKRHLGRRYRLDPSIPDAEFVATLAGYNPGLDRAALLDLLERLSARNPGEAQMVRLAAEASAWITAQ